jgi:hypothetical protein
LCYQQHCLIGIPQNPTSNQKVSRSKTSHVTSYIDNRRRSTFIAFPIKLEPMRHESWSGPVLTVLIAESSIMQKFTLEGL